MPLLLVLVLLLAVAQGAWLLLLLAAALASWLLPLLAAALAACSVLSSMAFDFLNGSAADGLISTQRRELQPGSSAGGRGCGELQGAVRAERREL